jgi:retron-type reverse transcriptase
MIEGDIKGYFDNINHKRLAHMLTSASLMDKNMIDLYWKLVNAGYVNNGHLEPHSLLGVPQGGTLSPLLSNIYLHAFDRYMEGLIAKYTTKKRRISKANPVYNKVRYEIDQLKNKSLKLGHP